MEKYFLELDDIHQEREMVLESIFYKNDLLVTFGPAMEADGDDANKDTSNTAANNIKNAGNSSTLENKNQKKDAQTTDKEGSGNDNSKAREAFTKSLKEVVSAISDFIKRYIADFNVSMSDLLNDNASTRVEIEKLVRNGKPDENITFKDYDYHNEVIANANKAISETYIAMLENYNKLKPYLNDLAKYDSLTDERKKEIINKLRSCIGKDENSEIYFPEPQVIIAKKLGVDPAKAAEMSPQDVKKHIVNSYKGLDEKGNGGPNEFTLKNNQNRLDSAVNFIRNYKANVAALTDNNSKLRTSADGFKNLCETMQRVDANIEMTDALKPVTERLSRDINVMVGFNECVLTCIKERGIASEIFIKKAYGQKFDVKGKANNLKNQIKDANAKNKR